jgi:asparagine synthase (glutamine-hydrolysing)
MCGLVAVIGKNGCLVDSDTIFRMSKSIEHRGPDGYGCYVSGAVGFGFQRLSILDLSSVADQPMFSSDGKKIIIFNGEIFNYIEIRQELKVLGYEFKTTGDTEVLLYAYCEWGSKCLDRLNGMWSFLIYDIDHCKIFGARDRFGIKPLYRYETEKHIFFASEIKAIIASNYYAPEVNWRIAAKYLLQERLDDEDDTFYSKIERVPAGIAFELSLDDINKYKYWRYWSVDVDSKIDIEEPVAQFLEIFQDAVRIRLRSDVPVGVCLSGGLDSTSIICMMKTLNDSFNNTNQNKRIQAFSYMPSEFDESKYINDTILNTNARLHSVVYDPSLLWERLNQILFFHDEPVLSLTTVIGFELFNLASSNGVKVVLNGQGADEYLSGYFDYFKDYWYSLLAEGQFRKTFSEISSYCKMHGGNTSSLFNIALQKFARTQLSRFHIYRKLKKVMAYERLIKNSWYKREVIQCLQLEISAFEEPLLDKRLKYSLECSALPLYLRQEDRNSMANSVEARLPFMDYRLISFVFSLPYYWKMQGGWNKYILRKAMTKQIPESVRLRSDKMGFPNPAKKWFAGSLFKLSKDIIESRSFNERGIYNPGVIKQDLNKYLDGKVDISRDLFRVLQFELWLRNIDSFTSSRVCL